MAFQLRQEFFNLRQLRVSKFLAFGGLRQIECLLEARIGVLSEHWRGEAQTDFAISLTAAAIIVLLVITLLANLTAVLLRNRYEQRW